MSKTVDEAEMGATNRTIAEKLLYADKIKSSEPNTLSDLLLEISDSGQKLTTRQHDYYQYLYGYSLAYNGKYLAAIEVLKNIIDSEDKELAYRAIAVISNSYLLTKQYMDVFYFLDKLDELEKFVVTSSALENGIGLKAMLYNKLGVYSLAKSYSLQLIENAQDPRYKCIGYQLYSEILSNLNDKVEFERIYPEAIEYCNSINELLWMNIIHAYEIKFLIEEQNFSRGLLMLDKHLAAVKATQYPFIKTVFYAFYAEAYFGLGHYERALENADLAIATGEIDNVYQAHLMAYNAKYKAHKALGDSEAALASLEFYSDISATYNDEKLSQQKAFYLARGEIETKNQRIALLDKDNELLYLQSSIYEQEVKNQRLMVTLLAVVVFIAIVLAVRAIFGRNRFKILAEFDHLTGISNRYHFNNQAKISLEYCETNNKPASLILFDLDFFKRINDDYGHATGDWALQKVVKSCRNFMRNNDIFGRIGGEEFSILLPGCQPDKALLLAEICREAISAIDTTESGHSFTLSASFGVSNSITSGYQLKQLLADADHAMYQAKKQGKNQVEEFEAH
ncbi:GGDEF domain-containing protein [Rheinheimera sp. WS51]|uniref:GGDEF domain-containing protein n=1 Tax=Rheinheimera sp. WS51 TaxID=3425886 RepID=UPI003D904B9D